MNSRILAESVFDVGRLAYVAVLAALVVTLDVAVLDLVGIESAAEAVVQFLIVVTGSYLGLTLVDVSLSDVDDE